LPLNTDGISASDRIRPGAALKRPTLTQGEEWNLRPGIAKQQFLPLCANSVIIVKQLAIQTGHSMAITQQSLRNP
jgi:hypothetical protein